MVNDSTKKIILIMTFVVIAVMAYLVHSPRLIKMYRDKRATTTSANNSKVKAQQPQISSLDKPSIGNSMPSITQQNIRIGIALPLSGEGTITARAIQETIKMSLSEQEQDLRFKYEIVFEDSNKGKSLENVVEDMVVNKKIDVLLSYYNNDADIVSKVSDKYKIPHMTCAFGANVIKNHRYTFNHYPTLETQAKAFLDNLSDNNIRIFSIIAVDKPYIIETIEAVEREAKKQNFTILNKIIVESDVDNFNPHIDIINKGTPEAIMVMLDNKGIELFSGEFNKKNVNNAVYTSIDLFRNFMGRGLIEGAVFVTSSDGDLKFKEDFRRKTVLQIPLCAPNMYDIIKMLVWAYESSERDIKLKSNELIDALNNIKSFPSATDSNISISKDRLIDSPMVNMKIDKGLLKYQ